MRLSAPTSEIKISKVSFYHFDVLCFDAGQSRLRRDCLTRAPIMSVLHYAGERRLHSEQNEVSLLMFIRVFINKKLVFIIRSISMLNVLSCPVLHSRYIRIHGAYSR